MRHCARCGLEKSETDFYESFRRDHGVVRYSSYCKPCMSSYQKARYLENPFRFSARSRERLYGISDEAYSLLLREQDGKCACCGQSFGRTPCVDHDHETGKVRGLLCHRCNIAEGFLRDATLVSQILAYVERTG